MECGVLVTGIVRDVRDDFDGRQKGLVHATQGEGSSRRECIAFAAIRSRRTPCCFMSAQGWCGFQFVRKRARAKCDVAKGRPSAREGRLRS